MNQIVLLFTILILTIFPPGIFAAENAFYTKARLEVITGATLQLDADINTTEFFIDGAMQTIGEYSASIHSGLITGSGKIIVGRPEIFTFQRGANGNWDNPAHYIPALLPLAGETVICQSEMETTSTVFQADIILRGAGSLRLRGNHTSTGTIYTEQGTVFKYNTGGLGMSLTAPVSIVGDATMIMESDNAAGSIMTLAGPINGSAKVSVLNNGKGLVNEGKLLLSGNNAGFTGTWDLTRYSIKYPAVPGYRSIIEGNSENAFGKGAIVAGLDNRVIFNHSKAAGDSLVLSLSESAKVILKVNLGVKNFVLNGNPVEKGEYSAITNPELFEGPGTIIVGEGSVPVTTDLPAFPGAEGHGKYVTGGRGGLVIYVTNLEDDNNPGSLRYAVNQTGPRIILFKVSGTIQLKSNLNISKGNVTIAGQTAPGDGITIRDYPVVVAADNVIIRFLRFRMGDESDLEADAIGGRYYKNIMIDHCSMSWSTDECVSFYQNENFTMQWCIISESLRNSVHGKGAHGYGGIWGGKNASFHHNLLAHHDSRNPRLGETRGDAFALTNLVDLRNNVIYNWMGNSCYGGEAMNVNIVNCYYKPGPATTKRSRIIAIDKLTDAGFPITNVWGKFYIDGNVLPGSVLATEDNWTYGVYNQFSSQYVVSTAEKAAMRLQEPLNPGEVTTHTAEKAYEKIMQYGGASLVRDAVDIRVIHDVSTGTATYMTGGNGSINGIIDTQGAVGGWPLLQSLDPPLDTDNDGMPDAWEVANNLSFNSPDDAQLKSVDGIYPNIEVYINSLVNDIISQQNKESIETSNHSIRADKTEIILYFNNHLNELSVTHNVDVKKIYIYNISGILVMNGSFQSSFINWTINDLKKGIYIVRVEDANNEVFSKKIGIY